MPSFGVSYLDRWDPKYNCKVTHVDEHHPVVCEFDFILIAKMFWACPSSQKSTPYRQYIFFTFGPAKLFN
jgi:hypothetical protein